MRTHTWWLLVGLAGCESSVTRVGPGLDPTPSFFEDTGNEGPNVDTWACDNREVDGTCLGYVGVAWDRITADSNCDGETFQGACPSDDIGGCRRDVDFPLEYVEYYYSGQYHASEDDTFLKADCELNQGEWIP